MLLSSQGNCPLVMGDTDLCPWDMGTFGSLSTRHFGPTRVAAAAEAKAVLMELGAEALQTPVNRLKSKDGYIFDNEKPENKISYASLTKGKKIERYLDNTPPFKPVSEYTIPGKPAPRRAALEKVTGKAQFAGDIRLPGMLYASILRSPAHGAKLRDKATVWVSTQTPFSARDSVAQALDIPTDKVRILTPFVGGGFGGKSIQRPGLRCCMRYGCRNLCGSYG